MWLKKKYLYIFCLFFFILWKPISTYIFPYDAAGRLITILSFLFLIFGLRNLNKNFIKNAKYFDLPILLWVIWVNINAIFINPVVNPNVENAWNFFQLSNLPVVIYLGIRLNFVNINIEKQWLSYLIPLLFYLILVLLLEKNNKVFTDRLGEYINPNEIAWIALLAIMSSFLISNNKYLRYITIVLTFLLILLTASKKALLSFVFFFVLYFLFFSKVSLLKRVAVFIIIIAFIGIVTPIILNKTVIGQRFQKSIEQNQEAEDDSELFDGRANYYIKGVEFFKNKPIVGIGLTNFLVRGDMEQEAHSEYVVQFAELGIIGLILFLTFHYRILNKLIGLYKNKSSNYIASILLISFLVFYSMFLGRWVYDNIQYNIFLALTVNTIIQLSKMSVYSDTSIREIFLIQYFAKKLG